MVLSHVLLVGLLFQYQSESCNKIDGNDDLFIEIHSKTCIICIWRVILFGNVKNFSK